MKRPYLLAGSLTAPVLLVGLLHLPAFRPVLGVLGWAPGCPAALEGTDPEAVEAFRAQKVREQDGRRLPVGTRVFGLELGVASREVTLEQARGHSWSCSGDPQGSVLECEAPGSEIRLQFAADRLVAIDAWHAAEAPAAALTRLAKLESRAERSIGPATHRTGERHVDFLAARPLRRAGSDYRYAGFIGNLSATNFGKRGARVREQYQWAPSES